MFGTGRRRMMTGDHVEVWREAPAEKDRQPYFSKRFIAQRSPGAIDWNLREALLILTMDELGSAHLQQFDSTSHTQDRTQRDLRTRHAGPSLQNWLDLPVLRADRRLAHAFHDCAHWFALARYGLAALSDINGAGVLHLDIKPDNICIPTGPAIFDPESGDGFHVAVAGLRLIDFAFSLWENKLPLGRALGMGIYEATEYQSRQLRNAIVAGERDDLDPIHYLDWRADLYGLGWTLGFILGDLPPLGSEGAPGWNAARLEQAEQLIGQLKSFDESWRDNPGGRLPAAPHRSLMERTDEVLAADDLQRSLAAPWQVVREPGWKARELATPMTIPAVGLRNAEVDEPPVIEHGPEMEHRPEWRRPLSGAKWPGLAALLVAAVAVAYMANPALFSSLLEKAGHKPAEAPAPVTAAAPHGEVLPAPPQKPAGAPKQNNSAAKETPVTTPAPPLATTPAAPPVTPAAPPAAPPPTAAQLGERLATRLRDAPPLRFESVLSAVNVDGVAAVDIQKAAAGVLMARWNAAALGDTRRASNLQALLWLLKKLPASSKQQISAALGDRYWAIAAAEGDRDWWRHRAGPDPEGRAWLTEAAQLADAGVPSAQHTLGHAQALGLGVSQDSAVAGRRLSQALANVSRQSLSSSRAWRNAHATDANRDANPAAADAVIVELGINLVSRKALSGADRRFAVAVVPGLKHLAELGEPAAAAMLGDIYACRFDPPLKREARSAYAQAQQDPGWAKVIPQRMATVLDTRACSFTLSRRGKAP